MNQSTKEFLVTDAKTVRLSHAPTPIPTNQPVPFRLAIFGEGGVGKTTLLLSFPKPIVIDTDGGLEGDAVARTDLDGDEWRPEDWKDLNALYFWLKAKVEQKGYKTIGIDSIDTLARFLLHEATDLATNSRAVNASTERLVTPEQQDYGKVANALDIFLGNLKMLSKSHGINIVITSGVREPDPDKNRTKRTFDVQPAVEAVLLYWANVYGEMEVIVSKDKTDPEGKREIESRVLWTRAGDPKRKGKTRFAALRPGVKNPTFDKMTSLVAAPKEGTNA